jgi:hypothetical protein
MLTLFSIPKPFVGHVGVIQMNALRSWTFLEPKCQIVIFGDEPGIAEAAAEIGAVHVADIERNEHGTPRLDRAFNRAQDLAEHRLTCYLNSDVIAFNDLLETATGIEFSQFLMLGERTDLDITEPLDFSDGWQARLLLQAREHGSPHGPTGMDYFVFPTGMIRNMPAFVVGRGGWDNWMVYNARAERIPIVNATRAVNLVHQTHDYAHHPGPLKGTWQDPESVANRGLLESGFMTQFLLSDATWKIKRPGGKPVRAWRHLRRALDTWPLLFPPAQYPLMRPLVPAYRVVNYVRDKWYWHRVAKRRRAEAGT